MNAADPAADRDLEATVAVPVRPPADPLGAPEIADVPADTAGHWDMRVWSPRPPL